MMSFLLWSIAVVVLSIYIRTLSHSIAGGDSGEIVAEGCKVFSQIVLVTSSVLVCYTVLWSSWALLTRQDIR